MAKIIYYELRTESGHMSSDRYSKYHDRLRLAFDGKIKHAEIYGLEQVKEHAQEIRATEGEYADYWRNCKLSIVKITKEVKSIEEIPVAK